MGAKPCNFQEHVGGILLAFGGIDHNDLTGRLLGCVQRVCEARNVHVYIVTGPGYRNYEPLSKRIAQMSNVTLTHATGVISSIMEKVSLAITSNGRTVYEMAHMNIPAIVVPQHEREKTHEFSRPENGFVLLEPFNEGLTEENVEGTLISLLDNRSYRKSLFQNTVRFCFDNNKQNVLNLISEQLGH